jgi:hypothetical protein
MKRAASIAVALILTAMACRPGSQAVATRDAEAVPTTEADVAAVLTELEALTRDLVSTVTSAPDPAQGLAQAQGRIERESTRLHPRVRAIRMLRGHEVSAETKKKLTDTLVANTVTVMRLKEKYEIRSASDPGFRLALDKLTSGYMALISIDE